MSRRNDYAGIETILDEVWHKSHAPACPAGRATGNLQRQLQPCSLSEFFP